MGVVDLDFYDRNAGRAYPLADSATGVDDSGALLPPGIVVDANIRFPLYLGQYLALGAVMATDQLVTAVLVAVGGPAAPPLGTTVNWPALVAVAAVTLPQPIEAGRPYAIESLVPGVGGWLVFGSYAARPPAPYRGRFSTASQTQLLPGCASPYRLPPVAGIGLAFATPLVGEVVLASDGDLTITTESIVVEGKTVTAISLGLADSGGTVTTGGIQAAYAGPCGARPESGTCTPPGISQLGPATPDCAGNVIIQINNASVIPLRDGTGVAIASPYRMATACPPSKLPDAGGYLPGDTGATPTIMLAAATWVPASPAVATYEPPAVVETDEPIDVHQLPLAVRFEGAPGPPWKIAAGRFTAASGPGWATTTAARQCVAVWDERTSLSSLGLRCRVAAEISADGDAGAVVNYLEYGAKGLPTYFLALVDLRQSCYELWYFNGEVMSRLFTVAAGNTLAAGTYTVTVEAVAQVGDSVLLKLSFDGPDETATVPFVTTDYGLDEGVFGLGTHSSESVFASFKLERIGGSGG